MTDPLKRNANLVEALGSALREGEHAVDTVPGLVKRILLEDSWREFVTQRGEHVQHEQFSDFVIEPPLRGIGVPVALVQRIVSDDIETVDLLEKALSRPHGGGRTKGHDMTLDPDVPKRFRGTSRDYALRRLRRDAPKLHADVLAKKLSAHAAMVKAGFVPPTFTLRADSAEQVANVLKEKLSAEVVHEVVRRLA